MAANPLLDIEVHPAANFFPLLDGAALEELAQDITAHGQRVPCVRMPDGPLLDGRNRYIACKMAGKAPDFTVYEGDDPAAFAWSMNFLRRDLTPSQKAMAAAEYSTFRNGSNQHAKKEGAHQCAPSKDGENVNKSAVSSGRAQADAAKDAGVSRRSVQSAAKVRRDAQPEVIEAVKAGKLTVKKAEKISKAKPEVQRKVAAAADPEKAAAEALDQEGCSDGPECDPMHNAAKFDDALAALTLATRHVNAITGPEKAPKPIPGGELLAGQSVRSHIRNAAEGIKGTRPHATCPYCFNKPAGKCDACRGTRWLVRSIYESAPADLRAKVEGKKK